ncbi:hypothetical protein MAR_036201 [Mya arenaria]|uniref:Uncharacterized protein n=1 Tax=Mya arenaria TaxID=6604 RepID=A0ABY7EPG0_MYAAR|nr:hypothetical protein MAR_036201 [Mya arenaria]
MSYNHLFSNLASTGRKPALLSIVKEHSNAYKPKTVTTKYPKMLTNLRGKDAQLCRTFKRCNDINIEVSKEEVSNVEKATKKQCEENLGMISGQVE